MPVFDKNGNEVFGFTPYSVGDCIDAFLYDQQITLADLSVKSGIALAVLEDIMTLRRRLDWEQAEAICAAVGGCGCSPQTLMNIQEGYYRHPKVIAAQQKQERKAPRRSLFGDLFRKAAVLT